MEILCCFLYFSIQIFLENLNFLIPTEELNKKPIRYSHLLNATSTAQIYEYIIEEEVKLKYQEKNRIFAIRRHKLSSFHFLV